MRNTDGASPPRVLWDSIKNKRLAQDTVQSELTIISILLKKLLQGLLSFYKTRKILISKADMDTTRTEKYRPVSLMNLAAKS